MDTILFILIIIIPALAMIYCRSTYRTYYRKKNSAGLCGQEVARNILDSKGLDNVYVVEVKGTMTDHYDSKQKVVRLSSDVFHGESIASLAIAAHECGHAIQDQEGYFFLKVRSLIFPIVNIGSSLAYYVVLCGFLFRIMNLIYIGIALVALGLLFQIITLPVEFNASSKALLEIKKYIKKEPGYEKMLRSAALTYVAGVIASALELLRLIGYTRNDR